MPQSPSLDKIIKNPFLFPGKQEEKYFYTHDEKSFFYTHFRNKRFMLDEMTKRNASKFAIFLGYENPCFFFVFYFMLFYFFLNVCPVLTSMLT